METASADYFQESGFRQREYFESFTPDYEANTSGDVEEKSTLEKVNHFTDKWLLNGSAWGSATGALIGDVVGASLGAMLMGPAGIVVGKMIGGFTVGMIGAIVGEYVDNKIGFGANYADFSKPGFGQGELPDMGPMESKMYYADRFIISGGGFASNIGHILLRGVLPGPLLFLSDVVIGTVGDIFDGMISLSSIGKAWDEKNGEANLESVAESEYDRRVKPQEQGLMEDLFIGNDTADLTDLKFKLQEAHDELQLDPSNPKKLADYLEVKKRYDALR